MGRMNRGVFYGGLVTSGNREGEGEIGGRDVVFMMEGKGRVFVSCNGGLGDGWWK